MRAFIGVKGYTCLLSPWCLLLSVPTMTFVVVIFQTLLMFLAPKSLGLEFHLEKACENVLEPVRVGTRPRQFRLHEAYGCHRWEAGILRIRRFSREPHLGWAGYFFPK